MQAASPYEKTNLRASLDFLSWLSHLKASKKARVDAYLCFLIIFRPLVEYLAA